MSTYELQREAESFLFSNKEMQFVFHLHLER
jgi:hypothetical protein